MRGISGTLVILFIVGYLASTVELPRAWSNASSNASSAEVQMADGWRRTAAGWQWDEAWKRPRTAFEQTPVAWRIHPFVIAALQVLISLFALVSAEPTPRIAMRPLAS